MKDFSYITHSHPAFIENLYRSFLQDPASVDPDLRKFFEGFDFAVAQGAGTLAAGSSTAVVPAVATATESGIDIVKELAVYQLIQAYRNKGHLIAITNPIRARKDRGANLQPLFFGLGDADMDRSFYAGALIGIPGATLREIEAKLQQTYAHHVGIEFTYITDQKKVDWLTREMESGFSTPIPIEKKKRILEKLNQGVIFEKFLHTKYIGQKRFSLEGGETTIAALDAIINVAAEQEVAEVVIGMAHRGRLNVLANIMGKTYQQIFSEFEGTAQIDQTMG
ncbi:MAG: 2-oxoglutarate dehydrogenase E1 component, partial [Sediminibacterium sp.]|nr:2-oxoglutarate dehydrogenase E1 component [Sediminibacterium sp.]